ncbi:MAG TPA: ATP-binding protein, partial [Polyangiales bacterium]|nr:ATP-binding protein [Polyangiales bacterium]
IDRAKTAFFSNVSHEFRTPLTLMLGPLEDALADAATPLAASQRERMLLVQRSGLRLLKLVNTLLDFSRIEAGRVQASYEATDLAAVTRDLASTFRSTVERGGLALQVACEALPEPAWVDREMWEKIVLNLISNAFKHTFAGTIRVALREVDGEAQLTVADTGVGIPASELPRLFERFHRVQGARGRSYEGSGIGLALVQELAKLHGGTVHVESELERGTTFTLRIPLGHAHLPDERLNAGRTMLSTATRVEAFVHEASGWVGDGAAALPAPSPSVHPAPRVMPRIVLADDNADMRDYVRRLLDDQYRVDAVIDGQAALTAVQAELPDLVLSDVMMPGLDGFGLLRTLKADPRTANVPVILLSARAGEEATLEGLQAGASDYMVKPFSARELLARVEGALRTARAQLDALNERARLSAVLASLQEGVVLQDSDGNVRFSNSAANRLLELNDEQRAGRVALDPEWRLRGDDGAPVPSSQLAAAIALQTKRPITGQLLAVDRADGATTWLHVNAQPIADSDGAIAGVVTSFFDVTAERERELEVRARATFAQQLMGIVSHDLRNPLNVVLLGTLHLLKREELGHGATTNLRRIQNAAERAVRLVRDLLDFTQARLGSGIPITPRPADLSEVVEQVLIELRTSHPDRDLRFEPKHDAHGSWDSDRLAQVVHNLISNAIKYGEGDVQVSVLEVPDTVQLEVHNHGTPIDPELLPRVFQPLARGHDDKARRTGSIGLGLFIVDQIVRAHGGEVTVSSTAQHGTTFTVRLPRQFVSLAGSSPA